MLPFRFRPGEDRSKPFMDRVPTVEEVIPVLPGGPAAYDPCFLKLFQLPVNAFYVRPRISGYQPWVQRFFRVTEKESECPVQRRGRKESLYHGKRPPPRISLHSLSGRDENPAPNFVLRLETTASSRADAVRRRLFSRCGGAAERKSPAGTGHREAHSDTDMLPYL